MNRHVRSWDVPALVCGEIGLVHSLGIAGVPVFVGSEFEENVALGSRFVEKKMAMPSYDSEEFIEKLMHMGKRFSSSPVLLTDNDQVVLAISRHRELLSNFYRFIIPERDVIEQIQDKRKFYKAAQFHNLPVPNSYTIDSPGDLENVISDIRFPCIIKPANTNDWQNENFSKFVGVYKKAFRCSDGSELKMAYEKVSRIHSTVILQEFIEGEDERHYSINMYFDRDRRLRGYYIYQKMRMYPIGAGRGSFFVTVNDVEILEQALQAAEKFEMCGLVNIQFKRDSRTGDLKLIEMEARLSVSSFLGPAAGMNLAARYYQDLAYNVPPEKPHDFQSGVKYSDLLRDIKAFVNYRKEGKLSFRDWIKSYNGKCVYNGYLLKDPLPIFKKMWYTLRKNSNGNKAYRKV